MARNDNFCVIPDLIRGRNDNFCVIPDLIRGRDDNFCDIPDLGFVIPDLIRDPV